MRGALMGLGLLVAGCAAPATVPPAPIYVTAAKPDSRPRLWYVGLGLFGESWSQNDVAALPGELAKGARGFLVVPIVLPETTEPGVIETTIADVAAATGPGDIVMIYASTHGAPGLLGRTAGGQELEPIGTAELKRWLGPLGGQDTVLLLSACFAGSFIPPLQESHRIVFTAARADRTSFGCQAGAEHTVFGDALLRALARPGTSLRDVVAATRATVTAQERELHVTQPSQPQVSVGADVTRLYNAPIF